MNFHAVLNRDGGTLRTTNLDAFVDRMKATFETAGHHVTCETVAGSGLVEALERAVGDDTIDAVIAGGGDGTVSAAAAILMNTDKALAILPAGTMNLFARSLQIPQQLDAAVACFASAETKSVDMATANGKPFVHQFSIGMHAQMVDLRDKMEFRSRLGKMRASLKAAYKTIRNPPSLKVQMKIDGAEIVTRTSNIGVSNNLFGEGHLPYADAPDDGKLGIYVTIAQTRFGIMRHSLSMLRGKWRDNDQLEIHETEAVDIRIMSRPRKFTCVIDGELHKLDKVTELRSLPGVLKVLVPKVKIEAEAA